MTEKQSLRARRAAEVARQRRQRRMIYGLVAAGAVIVVGLITWVALNPPRLEDVVLPNQLEPPAGAEGESWGPADAPVLVEEFSDFQ
jgi:hypothetical protein